MTLEELGCTLRAEREKRGFSIDAVATHLKISSRMIRALEEGDEISLPHAVYVKGFVRSYGIYLGLGDLELNVMVNAIEDEQDEPSAPVYATQSASRGMTGKIFFVIFLAACLAGVVFYGLYRDTDLFSEAPQLNLNVLQPKVSQDIPLVTVPSSPSASAGRADMGGQPSPSSVLVDPTTQAREVRLPQAVQATSTQPPAPSFTPQRITDTAQPQAMSSPAGQNKLIITALAECWIHSSADGTDTRQFSLRKGDTFALTFTNKLLLKLGNAGGVRIRYNGEDMPVPGKEGQVRTLTFPPTE